MNEHMNKKKKNKEKRKEKKKKKSPLFPCIFLVRSTSSD